MSIQFATLPLSAVVSSLTNPRKTFNATKLAELAASIQASGVHQPILVRPLPGSRTADTDRAVTHEIVSGERRYRASQQAGATSIPAMIRELTDNQVLEIQLVENLQRDDLTELEEAEGYQALMHASSMTADAIAAKIGKSRSYVFARLKLLDLCPESRTALHDGTIDASRALMLARIPDHKLQIKALAEITQKDYNGEQYMSVRGASAHIQQLYMLRLDAAPFKPTDTTLCPEAGSCKACSKRTGHDPDLFADVKGADVCTDPPCYHRKEQAHSAAQLKAAHDRGQTIIEGREAKALMPNSYGKVEGYLRLDEARDSPTDKPLRKLLGKQLAAEGIQPTLIANPHKAGELIAVLPEAKVAQLLKAQGQDDAASKVSQHVKDSKKAEAAAAKQKLETEYEQGWRHAVLERTWAKIQNDGEEASLTDKLLRYLAMGYAKSCNTDRAKRLGKLLNLGKVAPLQGLTDYVRDCEHPQDVLQLLVMHADVEYRSWLPAEDSNAGLLLVASDYQVDIDEVKDEIKAQMRSAMPQASPIMYRGPNGETWSGRGLKPKWVTHYLATGGELADLQVNPSPKTPLPQSPAAQAQGMGKAKKPKTSAAQAQALIAAALQSQESETNPGADAQGNLPDSSQPVATSAAGASGVAQAEAFTVGQRVRITTNRDKLGIIARKWGGKEGTVTRRESGGGYWDVTFRGRNGGVALFAADQIDQVVPA
jgi:ParB/RepB/Spo0J family partition protein